MAGIVRRVEGHRRIELDQGWELTSVRAAAARTPEELGSCAPHWIAAPSLGTAAAMLRGAGRFGLEGPPRRFDAEDWWYRCRLPAIELPAGERLYLCCDGLATVAEVFVDGVCRLRSDNMFVAHELDVSDGASIERELMLRFCALDPVLRARKPRPRWRVPMIEQQQLRWVRTSLLGRTPGWSPPVAPVGAWRPLGLEQRCGTLLQSVQLHTTLEGELGRIRLHVQLQLLDGETWSAARLRVEGPGVEVELPATIEHGGPDQLSIRLDERLAGVERWWPHTHGPQPLYALSLQAEGEPRAGSRIALGHVGFRQLALDTREGDFRLAINGVPVFWRGACWTPLDVVSLGGSATDYRQALTAVRAAGMNMLRVVGSMTYEQPLFYDLCDELGIALWHDLMFANMDYPEEAGFVRGVCHEVAQALAGWQGRPAIAIVCGDSEGEQQAAMWGSPRASWQRPLFSETLRQLCEGSLPEVPYWPSSSSGGGGYPHQPNAGPSSYYGVGAYLRPLEDARRSEVRFASECLAFANVPEPAALEVLGGDRTLHAHSPRWKERSPRDLGAGWDFDDVRDYYLQLLFGHDPVQLRYADHERYVALGRVASGEVMAAAFGEWRRRRSTCGGALVWFLRDLWLGAGWGLIDAAGTPKAAFHYLRRALQPVGLAFSDEGLSGLYAHVWNEGASELGVELRLQLFRHHEQRVAQVRVPLRVPGRDGIEHAVAASLDGFVDLTRAFRFGPPTVDLVVGSLWSQDSWLADAFYFPVGLPREQEGELGLRAVARPLPSGDYELSLETRCFAQSLAIDAPGYLADDMYFHLAPGGQRRVCLRARSATAGVLRGSVLALNARVAISIQLENAEQAAH